jgi:DNA polymerase-3 subunit epsilon
MRLEEVDFVAVDLETTGLDLKRDEILAFAAIPIRGMRIMAGDAFYTTLCPSTYKLQSMRYHGISAEDVEGAPRFAELAQSLLSTLGGMMVGFGIEIDRLFLQRFFGKEGIEFSRELVDIAAIENGLIRCRRAKRFDERLTFDVLLHRYGLRESYRHDALADAFFSAQIFQMQFMRHGIETLEELMDLMRPDDVMECAFML